ncbi:MAG: helix-turn-helix transcriptional regulator [bacterium]
MLAVVKTPRIKIKVEGEIPSWMLKRLKKEYGRKLSLSANDDEEYIEIVQTEWYKKVKKEMTPGKAIRIYRENHELTQEELGKKLGNISRQHISDMENDRRTISKNTAINLSKIFNTSVARFIG